jgi:hypothetical protein
VLGKLTWMDRMKRIRNYGFEILNLKFFDPLHPVHPC